MQIDDPRLQLAVLLRRRRFVLVPTRASRRVVERPVLHLPLPSLLIAQRTWSKLALYAARSPVGKWRFAGGIASFCRSGESRAHDRPGRS